MNRKNPFFHMAPAAVFMVAFVFSVQAASAQGTSSSGTATSSLDQVTSSVQNIRSAVSDASKHVYDLFYESVDATIRSIGQSESSRSGRAVELSNSISGPRQTVLGAIHADLAGAAVTQANIVSLETAITGGLTDIGNILSNEASDTPAKAYVYENIHAHDADITSSLNSLSRRLVGLDAVLASSSGNLLFKDSDNDGVSDYDEIYVYHTDPYKAVTTPVAGAKVQLTDGQKILQGIDPTSPTGAPILPEDPRTVNMPANGAFSVTDVSPVSSTLATTTILQFSGKALPNNIVTLYIFSTPIVVTVKADANGDWNYILNQELPDGQHQVYTAAVSDSGKILAKSLAFAFTKTAQAVSVDNVPAVGGSSNAAPSIVDMNRLFLIAGVIILLVIITLVIIGASSRRI